MSGEFDSNGSEQQPLVIIQFGDEDEQPVVTPVNDLAVLEDEEQKQRLIDSAWVFCERGRFAREATNPEFIKALAGDYSMSLPLPHLLSRLVLVGLGKQYPSLLEKEVAAKGEAVVDAHALHLKVEGQGTENVTIVIDPPEGWEEKALERLGELTSGLFARTSNGIASWLGFTEWIWINQLTRALGDLEEELGEDALAAMSEKEFEASLLRRMVEHQDSVGRFAELMEHYLTMLADIVVEGVTTAEEDLWSLELLLGFRDRPPDRTKPDYTRHTSSVGVDFGSLLRAVAEKPDDLYRLPPRRFEELVAHILERFGYEVQLTPQTRDGGFDISAIRKAETEVRLLIECKRYTPPRKVGRPVVQQIFGVLMDRDAEATKAIVATTSTFTPEARTFLAINRWRVEGRDRAGILEWIELVRSQRSGLWLPAAGGQREF
ncbi:MAG: restriction endonuclease [Bryobacteraceae bacterium]|jgi:hypothetical protein